MADFSKGFNCCTSIGSRPQAQHRTNLVETTRNNHKSFPGVVAIEFPEQELSCRIASVGDGLPVRGASLK